MSNSESISTRLIKRRTFLAGLGSASILFSACSSTSRSVKVDPIATTAQTLIQAKRELIADAEFLSTMDPDLSAPLQELIDQNLVHIDALLSYASGDASPDPGINKAQNVDLPALTTRCAVFSSNNLNSACTVTDAEFSRILALIAGSEMQQHDLLQGLIA